MMKCTRCRAEAFLRLPSHNAKFCPDCFDQFFLAAVTRALKRFPLAQDELIVVAVSGGKDSLALWDALHRLGRPTLGLHMELGLEEFSAASRKAVEDFAAARGLACRIYNLKEIFGYTVLEIKRLVRQEICSVCGSLKRVLLNRLSLELGGRVVATGHHLDDEAGRLLGNLVRNRKEYLAKFSPFLPSTHPAQAARMKPLYRLDEDEIRAYGKMRGIVSESGGCPLSKGATSRYFKEALNYLEEKMPGTKRDFLFTYIKEVRGLPAGADAAGPFSSCRVCGQPTFADLCAACRLKDRLKSREAGRAAR